MNDLKLNSFFINILNICSLRCRQLKIFIKIFQFYMCIYKATSFSCIEIFFDFPSDNKSKST